MRIFGGIISWFIPNRVIVSAASNQSWFEDILAHSIGFYLGLFGVWAFIKEYDVPFVGSSSATLLSGLFLLPLSFILTLVFTYFWYAPLIKTKNKNTGAYLAPSFSSLFTCHLHIYAVLMPILIVAMITQETSALILLGFIALRTADLEARVIRTTCVISLFESYKLTAFIFFFYIVIGLFVNFLINM